MKTTFTPPFLTRRAFLAATTGSSVLLANRLFGAPDASATKPDPALEKLAEVALAEARKQGASYCDIRIARYRQQFSGYRLSPDRGGNKTDEVPFVTDQQHFGFGVRVIAKDQWGFAASPLVTAEEIARITREAVVVAKANSALQASPVQLAPTKAYTDRRTSTFEKDPFAVAVDEKLDLMHNATLIIKKDPKVFAAFGFLAARAERKFFVFQRRFSIQEILRQGFPGPASHGGGYPKEH